MSSLALGAPRHLKLTGSAAGKASSTSLLELPDHQLNAPPEEATQQIFAATIIFYPRLVNQQYEDDL